MAFTTFTSREFNRNTVRARRAANQGPVFITDHGLPTHVLLSIDEYRKITDNQPNILDLLAMPEAADIEFDPPRLDGPFHYPVDFS